MPTIASGPKRTDNGPQLPYSIQALTTWSFPQNLPGLSVWFDASDATTINSIGSNLVSWRSKDSNAIIMSNGNYPLGPTVIQNVRNGLPVVRFDGTNNSFISSIVSTYNSSNFTLNNQTTMFVAYNRTNNGTPFNIVDTAGRGSGARIGPQGGTFFYGNINSGINNIRIDFTVPNDTTLGFRVDSFYAYSQTVGFRLSGSTFATSNLPTPTSFPTGVPLIVQMGGINLGGRLFTQDLGEVILYNRGLSDTEIASIEAYLAKKWATTAAFPLGHVGRTTFNTRMGFRFLTYALPVSNAVLWWDAMDITTFRNRANVVPTTTNDRIQYWFDKIYGSYAYLANNALQPKFNMFGINRYPCIETYETATGGGLQGQTGALNSNVQFTGCNISAFIVYAHDQTNNNHVIFSLSCNFNAQTSSNSPLDFTVAFRNNNVGFSRYSDGSIPIVSAPIQKGAIQLIEVIVNSSANSVGGALPSNTTIFINGLYGSNTQFLTLCNFNFRSADSNSWLGILRGQNFGGGIGGAVNEISVFYRPVNTSERVAMENQLFAKWGIARNQPVAYLATGVPVTSGLQMWYDAYLPAFVTTNSSNQVTSWLDRSGNGFHMSNAGLNPVIYTTLTGLTNNLPALQFTFSNATSNHSALQNYNISNLVTSTITTIASGYFTANPIVSAPEYFILSMGSTINGFESLRMAITRDVIYDSTSNTVTNNRYTQSNFQIHTLVANMGPTSNGSLAASNMVSYMNGSNPTTSTAPFLGMLNISNARIGASLFNITDANGPNRTTQGFFTEFLVWNRCLTIAELGSVHTYLFNKWTIVSNAPVASVPVSSGLTLWLDAYDPAQVVRDSGGNVWLWRDKSGCNFHFSNNGSFGEQVLRPTYSTTSVGGLPGLLFFTDNTLRTSLSCLNISYPITPNLSIFIVFQQRSMVSANGRLIAFTSNTDNTDFNFTNGFSIINASATNIGINRSNTIPSIGGINTVRNLISVIFNGSSTTIPDVSISNVGLGRNGVISVNSSNGSLQANFRFNQAWLGTRNGALDNTSYYDGYLSEVILYNRTVTFLERQQIESYLLNKWNI